MGEVSTARTSGVDGLQLPERSKFESVSSLASSQRTGETPRIGGSTSSKSARSSNADSNIGSVRSSRSKSSRHDSVRSGQFESVRGSNATSVGTIQDPPTKSRSSKSGKDGDSADMDENRSSKSKSSRSNQKDKSRSEKKRRNKPHKHLSDISEDERRSSGERKARRAERVRPSEENSEIYSIRLSEVESARSSAISSVRPSTVDTIRSSTISSVRPSEVESARSSAISSARPSEVDTIRSSTISSVRPSKVESARSSKVESARSSTLKSSRPRKGESIRLSKEESVRSSSARPRKDRSSKGSSARPSEVQSARSAGSSGESSPSFSVRLSQAGSSNAEDVNFQISDSVISVPLKLPSRSERDLSEDTPAASQRSSKSADLPKERKSTKSEKTSHRKKSSRTSSSTAGTSKHANSRSKREEMPDIPEEMSNVRVPPSKNLSQTQIEDSVVEAPTVYPLTAESLQFLGTGSEATEAYASADEGSPAAQPAPKQRSSAKPVPKTRTGRRCTVGRDTIMSIPDELRHGSIVNAPHYNMTSWLPESIELRGSMNIRPASAPKKPEVSRPSLHDPWAAGAARDSCVSSQKSELWDNNQMTPVSTPKSELWDNKKPSRAGVPYRLKQLSEESIDHPSVESNLDERNSIEARDIYPTSKDINEPSKERVYRSTKSVNDREKAYSYQESARTIPVTFTHATDDADSYTSFDSPANFARVPISDASHRRNYVKGSRSAKLFDSGDDPFAYPQDTRDLRKDNSFSTAQSSRYDRPGTDRHTDGPGTDRHTDRPGTDRHTELRSMPLSTGRLPTRVKIVDRGARLPPPSSVSTRQEYSVVSSHQVLDRDYDQTNDYGLHTSAYHTGMVGAHPIHAEMAGLHQVHAGMAGVHQVGGGMAGVHQVGAIHQAGGAMYAGSHGNVAPLVQVPMHVAAAIPSTQQLMQPGHAGTTPAVSGYLMKRG